MTSSKRGSARAVADVNAGVVVATVDIDAEPSRVFEALSTPEVAQWWGAPAVYRVTDWSMDRRPGGAWESVGVGADGKPFRVFGTVLEVDAPRSLAFTWTYDWGERATTTVRYRLESHAGGTRVTVRHEGFGDRFDDCRSHGEGWGMVLGWLVEHLASARRDS